MDLKSDKGKALSKQEALNEIKMFLQEQIELAHRKAMVEENFSNGSWAFHQAYLLGMQKAFTKLYNLIPDQGDYNGRNNKRNTE
jgi:hypothetical protein